MKTHQVVIAGGGPTGLTLAAELALAGVDVAIVERRASADLVGSRAGGLHARTMEVFDQRGIADRFLKLGKVHKVGMGFHHTLLDISDLPSRHNYFLSLWQQQIEMILGDWASELNVKVYRGVDVIGFTQNQSSVQVQLSNKTSMGTEYLVACDGGRSTVRKSSGIDFVGWEPTKSWLIAELKWEHEPAWGMREDSVGVHGIGKLDDEHFMRVVLTEPTLTVGSEPTMSEVLANMNAVFGTDYGGHSPKSISRFSDVTRQATSYCSGRVLLAGDAAHVHPPMGGQGLNIGVQDAMNLGWKLAQVVKGVSPVTLLDSYQEERHPIAARVLRNTISHVVLQRADPRVKVLGETLAQLYKVEGVRKQFITENAGLSIRYDFGSGHLSLGHRIPDLHLITSQGEINVFSLLHKARPVMLNLGEPYVIDLGCWSDRVILVDAELCDDWVVPDVGLITAPKAVLIRPDGYVVWTGDEHQVGLTEALSSWFGSFTAT